MAITINTSDYIKTKAVRINGEDFKFRPMSTSEYIAFTAIQEEMQGVDEKDTKAAVKAMNKLMELIYSLFDNPKRVEELLEDVPLTAIAELVEKLTAEEE